MVFMLFKTYGNSMGYSIKDVIKNKNGIESLAAENASSIEAFTELVNKYPNSGELYNNLAQSLYYAKDYDGAVQNYYKALRYLPKEKIGKTEYNLANAYYQKNDYKKAIHFYKQALKINPDDKELRFNLEMALKQLSKPKKQSKLVLELLLILDHIHLRTL